MEVADLARWTPIRFDFSGSAPTVDRADLSAERFVETTRFYFTGDIIKFPESKSPRKSYASGK